ncbi:MAG: CBS domain-containing protein [Acidobacteria bacterium]|nr:CBS domain-containing protein [Acidobacteriota bacterium]
MRADVKAWMKAPVHTLTEEASLMDAIHLTRRHHIRHVPIVRNGATLVGIVSDRDIMKYSPSILTEKDPAQFQRVLEQTKLARIMTREPTTVAPTTPLREAVEIFCLKKIGALPVIAGGKLVGIVTDTDMLRAFLEGLVRAEKKRQGS